MIAESVESDLDSPILMDVASGLPDIQLHSEDSGTDVETKSCLPDPRHDTDTNTKLHSLVDKEDVVRTRAGRVRRYCIFPNFCTILSVMIH